MGFSIAPPITRMASQFKMRLLNQAASVSRRRLNPPFAIAFLASGLRSARYAGPIGSILPIATGSPLDGLIQS
jgi:hypothetical protein